MLDAELAAFVAPGTSLIVGAVTPDGAPFATRAWSFVFEREDEEQSAGRIGIGKAEFGKFGDRPASLVGTTMAVTVADVATLRSLQLKGPVLSIDEPTEKDASDIERHYTDFTDAVLRIDGIPKSFIERLIPNEFVMCTLEICESYDQSPGPGAGASLFGGRR